MDHLEAVGPEHRGDLLPHPHHVVGAVGGTVGVALLVHVPVRLAVRLAAVGVDNQNLWPLPQRDIHRSRRQHRRIQRLTGAVIEIDVVLADVLAALLALGRHLHNIPLLGGRLQVGLLLVLPVLVVELRVLPRQVLAPALPGGGHCLLPCRQQRRLPQQKPPPPREGLFLAPGQCPQLPLHERHCPSAFRAPGRHRLIQGGKIHRHAHTPDSYKCQAQSNSPPQGTSHLSVSFVLRHSIVSLLVRPAGCVWTSYAAGERDMTAGTGSPPGNKKPRPRQTPGARS